MIQLLREDPHLNVECTLVDNEGRKAVFVVPLQPDGTTGRLQIVMWDDEQPNINKAMVASVHAEVAQYIQDNQQKIAAMLKA